MVKKFLAKQLIKIYNVRLINQNLNFSITMTSFMEATTYIIA